MSAAPGAGWYAASHEGPAIHDAETVPLLDDLGVNAFERVVPEKEAWTDRPKATDRWKGGRISPIRGQDQQQHHHHPGPATLPQPKLFPWSDPLRDRRRQRRSHRKATTSELRRQFMSRATEKRLEVARKVRREEEAALRKVLEEGASIKLQAATRGFAARRMIREHTRAVGTIMKRFRAMRERRRQRAAARIQALYRGWQGRIVARVERGRRQAVVRIQAMSRGHTTRRMGLLTSRRRNVRALLCMQSLVRGWVVRTELQRLKNWVQCFNEDENRACFYNIRADCVQYHRPDEWYDEVLGRALHYDYEHGCWQWHDAEADDWVQCVDEETYEVAYFNTETGQTQWGLPTSWGGCGWSMAWHEQERAVVYVASTTLEYRQERPSAYGCSRWLLCENVCAGEEAFLCSGSNVSQLSAPAGCARTSAWVRAMEPDLRVACFMNIETGELRWRPPEAFVNDDSCRAEATSWVQCSDLRTRRRCFWNAVTRRGAWTLPRGHTTVGGDSQEVFDAQDTPVQGTPGRSPRRVGGGGRRLVSPKDLGGRQAIRLDNRPGKGLVEAPTKTPPKSTASVSMTDLIGTRTITRNAVPIIEMGDGLLPRRLQPMCKMPSTLPPRLKAVGLLNADGQYGPPASYSEDPSSDDEDSDDDDDDDGDDDGGDAFPGLPMRRKLSVAPPLESGGPPVWPRVTLTEMLRGMDPPEDEGLATTMLRTKLGALIKAMFSLPEGTPPSLGMVKAARRMGVPMPLSLGRRPVTDRAGMPALSDVRSALGFGTGSDGDSSFEDTRQERQKQHLSRLAVMDNCWPGSNRRAFIRLLGMDELPHPAKRWIVRNRQQSPATRRRRRLTVREAKLEATRMMAVDADKEMHSPGLPEKGAQAEANMRRSSRRQSLRMFSRSAVPQLLAPSHKRAAAGAGGGGKAQLLTIRGDRPARHRPTLLDSPSTLAAPSPLSHMVERPKAPLPAPSPLTLTTSSSVFESDSRTGSLRASVTSPGESRRGGLV